MPKRVPEQYDELMHYTTGAGLVGIVESGCVWATDARYLNDAREMTHFFDSRLADLAFEPASWALEEKAKDPEFKRLINEKGGMDVAIQETVNTLVRALRETTLKFNQAHIFSLSKPTNDRVRKSGLMSQWRGYGSDGGYAIVFDPEGFEDLLKKEESLFRYQFMTWGDVFYYGIDDVQPAMEEVRDAEEKVASMVREVVKGANVGSIGEKYFSVTFLSCLFKHWGFEEEQEVRVVAIPESKEQYENGPVTGNSKVSKERHFYSRTGVIVPYIELFRIPGHRESLPIKKVIVGPHRDSEDRRRSAEMLLLANGYDVPVIASEIPYIGR